MSQCVQMVSERGGYHERRCPRPGRYGPAEAYCKVHEPTSTDTVKAIGRLRSHFRLKAQHADDCLCVCCEAIEVLASRLDGR